MKCFIMSIELVSSCDVTHLIIMHPNQKLCIVRILVAVLFRKIRVFSISNQNIGKTPIPCTVHFPYLSTDGQMELSFSWESTTSLGRPNNGLIIALLQNRSPV